MSADGLAELASKFPGIGKLLRLVVISLVETYPVIAITGMTEPDDVGNPEMNAGENPAAIRADGKFDGAWGNTVCSVSVPRLRPSWKSEILFGPKVWVSWMLAFQPSIATSFRGPGYPAVVSEDSFRYETRANNESCVPKLWLIRPV
jgi:hypothetical protein